MAELWDIAHDVEAHPDDYEKRWKLAKKLYAAWEYRLALEHLLILKNEWNSKANVLRYLGATYYRLGRYDESTKELYDAIKLWPEEVGLYEQLARAHVKGADHIGQVQSVGLSCRDDLFSHSDIHCIEIEVGIEFSHVELDILILVDRQVRLNEQMTHILIDIDVHIDFLFVVRDGSIFKSESKFRLRQSCEGYVCRRQRGNGHRHCQQD